jgi:hypothetical protein
MRIIGNAGKAREVQAVASGVLPSGQPVIVNADGTVSVVGADSTAAPTIGEGTIFNSGAASDYVSDIKGVYDANAQKVVLAYSGAGKDGIALVGTVSGSSVSFGSPVTFATDATDDIAIAYDNVNNKVVIAFDDAGNLSKGTYIVGTVSGTSISFGSEGVYGSNGGYNNQLAFDENAGKFVFFYIGGGGVRANAVAGTVSGTTMSFGTVLDFGFESTPLGISYDSTAQKCVGIYRANNNSNYGTAVVFTISGTTVSKGTETVFLSSAVTNGDITYDSTASKHVIGFRDGTNSSKAAAVVGTVSGTSISFGSIASLLSIAGTGSIAVSYVPTLNKTLLTFEENEDGSVVARELTVSGTSVSAGAARTVSSADTGIATNFLASDAGSLIVAFDNKTPAFDEGTALVYTMNDSNLTSENYIGMSGGAVIPSVNGTKTSFNSSAIGSEVTGSVYDPDTGKIIICYTRGSDNHGLAVVGTVSGTTLSFGTPVVFNAAVTDHTGITYDTANNKVLIVYKNVGNNNYGTAIVGTVSGTSISFGTPVVYFSARSHGNKATFDTNAGKSLVVWLDDDNNDVESAVATISGTSVSFGSTVTVDANANYDEVVFDSSNNKVVVVYRDLGNSNYGTAIVGTISGTSVSFGSEVVFNTGSTSDIHCAFDSTNNKVIISFKAGSDGDKAKAIVGTVSGTAISFGSLATINDAESQQPKPVYNSVQQELIFEYELSGNGLYYRTASVSGTSIVNIGAQVTLASGFNALVSNLVYHPTENVAVVGFKDSGDSNKGNAIAFSTEVRGQVADGGNAEINIKGAVAENQSGLTAGQSYYVQTDGTLGTTPADPSVFAGTAVAATKLIVKG